MIKLTNETAVASVVAVTTAVLVIGTLPGDSVARPIIAAVAALIVLAMVFAPGGRSAVDRFVLRRGFARPFRLLSLLYSTLRVGTVWDGESMSMFVALRPLPFQVTVVGATETGIQSRALPLELIRNHLVQGDVTLESIRVIATGYRAYGDTPYGKAYTAVVGKTEIPDTLRTVIEIRVNLAKSYQSVLARATNGSVPTGIGKAAHIVSRRLEQQLNIEGFSAKLLKPSDIRNFHDMLLGPINDGFHDERWTHLGGEVPTVTAEPTEWSELGVERWFGVPADRMAYVVEIANDRHLQTSVGMTLAYSYSQATKLPARSLRLRSNDGAHGNHATALLPLAQTVAAPAPTLTVGRGADFPISLPAYGLGVYLGPSSDGAGRVFLNTETSGDVLWLETPEAFVHQLAARMTTTGARVGVHIESAEWSDLAGRVLGLRLSPANPLDVAIYQGRPPEQAPAATVVIVWAPQGAPPAVTHRITADDNGVMTVISRTSRAKFDWEAPPVEVPFVASLAG